jgi:hypothetical protein
MKNDGGREPNEDAAMAREKKIVEIGKKGSRNTVRLSVE